MRRIAVQKLGNVTELGRRTGYNRKSVYRHFDDPILPTGILLKYGKALQHDFTIEIPELLQELVFREPTSSKKIEPYDELKDAHDEWRNRYFELLHKYNDLLEKNNALLEDRHRIRGERVMPRGEALAINEH